jgi:hypothetical protein
MFKLYPTFTQDHKVLARMALLNAGVSSSIRVRGYAARVRVPAGQAQAACDALNEAGFCDATGDPLSLHFFSDPEAVTDLDCVRVQPIMVRAVRRAA